MKQSNILVLLIALLALLFIALTFVTSAKSATSKKKDYLQKEIALSDISVIVGEPHSRFDVMSGNENKLVVGYSGIKDICSNFYKVKNDTLYFLKPSKSDDSLRFIVQCKNLKNIDIKKSSVCSVAGFKAKSLTLHNNDGKVVFGDKSIHNFGYDYWVEVEQLHFSANKGKVLFQNIILNSASIHLKHVEAKFLGEVNIGNLDLQLSDSTDFTDYFSENKGNIRSINIKADATSKFGIHKN